MENLPSDKNIGGLIHYTDDRRYGKIQMQMEENQNDLNSKIKRVSNYRNYHISLSKTDTSILTRPISNMVSASKYPLQQVSSKRNYLKSKLSRKRKKVNRHHLKKPRSIKNRKIYIQNLDTYSPKSNSRQLATSRGPIASTMLGVVGTAYYAYLVSLLLSDQSIKIQSTGTSTSDSTATG